MYDDGGPAFPPSLNHNDGRAPETGMTLRDYFASDAMKGWVSAWGSHTCTESEIARRSYVLADAMLKARNA